MILGIDLGTCNTLAATLTRDGHPVLIADVTSKATSTPSLLMIEDKMALAGGIAEQYMDLYPGKNYIRYFKRFFGTQQPVFIDAKGNPWFSEALAAVMLKKIRFDAEMVLPEPPESVVVTVPAHYNDAQRKSVLEAAKLADINLAGLVDEPVAAALSYMSNQAWQDEIIMIYDFGGGTFDLTLVTRTGNQVHVLAKDGLSNLGGKEFDEIIADRIAEDYRRCFGEDIPQQISAQNKLKKVSEMVKLGVCGSTEWYGKWISFSTNAFEFNISLHEFEKKSNEFIRKTQSVVDRCLRSIGVSFSDINKIIMVGGTSNIPFIKSYWMQKINPASQELIYHQPMASVALGAAVYAGGLYSNGGTGLQLKSVSSYNIAVKSGETGPQDLLIYKNCPLPVQATRIYRLDPGAHLSLALVQYWDEEEVFTLGHIRIGPFPEGQVRTLELIVDNKSNGTIGLKVKHAESRKDLKFSFEKEPARYEYNAAAQKKLLENIVINNIY